MSSRKFIINSYGKTEQNIPFALRAIRNSDRLSHRPFFSVPAYINSGVVKKKVNAYFFQKTGGSIAVEESVIHLFPLPHIDIRQVRISVPKKADGLIQSLDIYPALWPLLRGNVQFSKLSLESPRFTIALSEDKEKTSLDEIEAKINLDDKAEFEITDGQMRISADEIYPWITSFENIKPVLKD